jgi:hypothetical protein
MVMNCTRSVTARKDLVLSASSCRVYVCRELNYLDGMFCHCSLQAMITLTLYMTPGISHDIQKIGRVTIRI